MAEQKSSEKLLRNSRILTVNITAREITVVQEGDTPEDKRVRTKKSRYADVTLRRQLWREVQERLRQNWDEYEVVRFRGGALQIYHKTHRIGSLESVQQQIDELLG